uniref:NADH-ubiquinone oxidoreductase chain 3 n=1 Tax=Walchia hayashii TaxID=436352 RepID=B3IUL1_9ACAR|nr:NADH dehydrogenase subunit 3 [Walchia hayashii]BAG24165.1 NADH dehydrogenase subunit 3 [Walchia hayashii]
MNIMMTTLMLMIMLITTWTIISPTEKENQTMNSPFESGFENFNSSFIPFSSQYFMIALVFLIFDLEIVMTLPMPQSTEKEKTTTMVSAFLVALMILMMKEMKISSTEWMK